MELKTYVCPNCGANTTNAENCEYCGSLLVRFVEKGIDLSQTSYTDNSEVFPGLISELKKNLKLQEDNKGVDVSTVIFWVNAAGDIGNDYINSASSENLFMDGTPMNLGPKSKGLIVTFDFSTPITDDSEISEITDAELKKFKQLKSFPLFTSHYDSFVSEEGIKVLGRQYVIHFGEDAEGAARLISEVLTKVKGLKPTDSYDFYTTNVRADIKKVGDAWFEAHGFGNSNTNTNNSGCAGVLLAGVVLIGTAIAALL